MAKRKKRSEQDLLTKSIGAILLTVLAIIIVLAFFGNAGLVGQLLDEYILSPIFGLTKYATPFILVVFAWFLVKDQEYNYRKTHMIGAVLFFFTVSSLLHIGFDIEEMWRMALEGHGGGLVGMGAWALKTYLGSVASVILLLALFLISIILLFNTALTHFVVMHRQWMERLGGVGAAITEATETMFVPDEDEEEEGLFDDDEEYEDDEPEFTSKRIGADDEEDDEEYEDDDEEEEEEETRPAPKKVAAAANTVPASDDLGIDQVAYMQNVIIKKIPPLDLLSSKKGKPTSGDIKANLKVIEDTFADFRIEVDMGETRVGPTVTQFTLKPPKGVKLARLTSLSNNLALALAAHPIRIEAPIPGTSLVGIEVPNEKAAQVSLKELLEAKEFTKRPHNMMMALGKDVGGKTWFADLPKMPHVLVAGATGSGKTVCVNTILLSLLYQNTAETLRLIMVDPKRVELTPYNGIPHLLTPVITDVQKTVNALKWAIGEMDRRFEVLAKAGNRDINTYNEGNPDKRLPHIVFVIDELADLMQNAGNEIEAGIIRLAQMARAVGIHLILATQRPSVDVITGLMKANIPGRIAFSVASLTDSRTILDSPGAEKLLGRGDMLLSTAALSKPVRIQGAFVSETEVKRVIEYLKGDEEPHYDESIVDASKAGGGTMSMFGGPTDSQDPLIHEAKAAVLEAGKASASYLQRRLRVGYARAARILDELEEAGVVGPADGSKPRDILVTEMDVSDTMQSGGEKNVFDQPQRPPASRPAVDEDEEEYEDEDEEYDEEEEMFDDEDDQDLDEDTDTDDEENDEEEEDQEYEDEEDDDEEEDEDEDSDDEYGEEEGDEEYEEDDEEDRGNTVVRSLF